VKLYDIAEPTKKAKAEEIVAIGIDLGTTNSLVSILKDGKPFIIPQEDGRSFLPSVVKYLNSNVIVGSKALEGEGERIASVKRLMGKGTKDIKDEMVSFSEERGLIKIIVNDKEVSPVEVSAEILKSLKRTAESYIGKKVTHAVITVPAYFDEASRAATKDAARLAGLEVLRLINEPTAAAVAYGLEENPEGTYAIYDLGGGTFDVTILKMSNGIFQVLATGGDANFGGDDLDKLLLECIFEQYQHDDCNSLNALIAVRGVKEHLSSNELFTGFLPFVKGEVRITKKQFEELIAEKIDRTINCLKKCIKDSEISKAEIDELILVGGSTRLPLIAEKLKEFMGKAPLSNVDPDQIVAMGAAIQAYALTSGGNTLLLDVTPLSLGIEVADGLVERVIMRNSAIPCSQTKVFTTQKEGQTGFKIHVLQGESDKVSGCRSLARFELKGIPSMQAGEPRLEITFVLDADGILSVSCKELLSSTIQSVEIRPSYGLTEEKILNLIKESL
jgi:molecular chaperone HscA